MPDRIYTLIYQCHNADALAKTAQLHAELAKLDALATQLHNHLKGYATGSGTSVNAAAKAAEKYAANLTKLQVSALGAGAALQGIHAPALAIGGSMDAGSTSLLKFTGALGGVALAHKAFAAVMEMSKELEATWKKLAEGSEKFRDTLRELASIKGMEGPGGKLYKEVLTTALETGITPEKAGEALAAYENIGPTVRAKGHYKPGGVAGTAEQRAALEQQVVSQAIVTGRRFGVSEETAAESMGTAGMFHTITSPESAMSQLGTAFKGLSEGKVKYTEGAIGLNKAAAKLLDPKEAAAEGATPGRLQSYGEAGVYLGALSLGTNTGQEAAHRMVQISRVMNAVDPKKVAELEKMGITKQMDDPAKLIRMAAFMQEEKVADPLAYLAERKLGAPAELMSVVGGLKVTDVLKQRLDVARKGYEGDATGKAIVEANARAMKRDQASINAQVRAAAAVTEKAEGAGGPEQYETAKAAAETRLANRDPQYRGLLRNLVVQASSLYTYPTRGVGGTGAIQEKGATLTLRREAKRVGVDLDKKYPGLESSSYSERAKAFGAAAAEVTEAGGDPYGLEATKASARGRVGALHDEGKPKAAGGGGGGGGGVGPQAGIGGASGGDAVQLAQLEELKRLNDKLGAPGGGGVSVAMGPAPVPGGAVRVGES